MSDVAEREGGTMPKVLLIEDNGMKRDMLSRRLTRRGYEVLVAEDGEKGVAMVEPAAGWEGLIDLFGRGDFSLAKDDTVTVELEGYGCRWLRVRRAGETILL